MIGEEKYCSMCNVGFYQSEFGGKCIKIVKKPVECAPGLVFSPDQDICVPEGYSVLSLAILISALLLSVLYFLKGGKNQHQTVQ